MWAIDKNAKCSSYIPGTAVVEPYPDWALTDEALVSAAELLRNYHDAASTFGFFRPIWRLVFLTKFCWRSCHRPRRKIDNFVFW